MLLCPSLLDSLLVCFVGPFPSFLSGIPMPTLVSEARLVWLYVSNFHLPEFSRCLDARNSSLTKLFTSEDILSTCSVQIIRRYFGKKKNSIFLP